MIKYNQENQKNTFEEYTIEELYFISKLEKIRDRLIELCSIDQRNGYLVKLTLDESKEISDISNNISNLNINIKIKEWCQYIYGASLQFIIDIDESDYDDNLEPIVNKILIENSCWVNLSNNIDHNEMNNMIINVSDKISEYYNNSYCKWAFMIGVSHSLILNRYRRISVKT